MVIWENGNLVIGFSPFPKAALGKAFGTSGEGLPADVNNDGAVDISDLVIVGIHFGETTNQTTSAAPLIK